ncbi:MAG: hypothetical protein L3K15_09255 [Thermoplasmata archaeon]|nr:hypothetical protein [Thermoplasmata archaeon]
MAENSVVEWLLEENQPCVRYYALTGLLDRGNHDPEVRAARRRIPHTGWASDILKRQGPNGFWERREPRTVKEYLFFLWFPEFSATIWSAIVLADLGLTKADPRIRKTAERLFEYKLGLSSMINLYHEEMCAVGNAAGALARFGYEGDPRVRRLYDWILDDQRSDGGWNCSQGTPGTLERWEPLAALAAVPKSKRSNRIERSIQRGAEFYLQRGLFREGSRYAPWFRFHYPHHYFYDVLVGLDLLTNLGYADDRRLRPALQILREKRRNDGSWLLDRANPDAPASLLHLHVNKVRPLQLEPPGRPSKWITLTALRVLKKVDEAS